MPEEDSVAHNDQTLLEQTAAGDGSAFAMFVERHRAAVFRFVRALAQSDFDAEDALQETFVSAWRSAHTYAASGSAKAWLFAIARNAVRRQHRRRVGEPADFVPLDELGLNAGWGSPPLTNNWSRLEDRELLERALAALSEDDREILVLRDLEGLSNEEAANLIQLSVGATKSRLHRARLRLAAYVRKELHAGA